MENAKHSVLAIIGYVDRILVTWHTTVGPIPGVITYIQFQRDSSSLLVISILAKHRTPRVLQGLASCIALKMRSCEHAKS